MSWLHRVRDTIAAILGRRRADQELAEEIRHHLELESELNRKRGLTESQARQEAARAFGGTSYYADQVRDERGGRTVDILRQDLRFAVRSLTRQASFALLVIGTLAFGIGATTALVAVIRSVLLSPLPYGKPESVAVIWSAWRGFDRTWLSYDEWEAWRANVRSLADVGIYSDGAVNLTEGDRPERIRATAVGANVFAVLGVAPALGRSFTADEDRPGGPAAAILSHELWQRRYGADPAMVGRTVSINGTATPVVGIMPPGFKLPVDFGASGRTELYQPLATDAAAEGALPGPPIQQGSHGFFAVARLKPGATVAGVNAELDQQVRELVRAGIYPAQMQFRAYAVGIADQITGPIRGPLLILLGAVGVVLLIACANAAGLLLVRGERRRRELAVRVALGAETGRVTRLLLTESALLALGGAGLGAALAWGGVAALRHLAPATLPRVAESRVDPLMLVVVLGLASLAALLTGVLPSLQAARVAPSEELKEGSRGSSGGLDRLRWRQALVTTEVALAVVLVVGAGLLIRTVGNLLAIDPGFSTDRVMTMRLSTPSTWYPDSARVAEFWAQLQPKIAAIPGVRSVGAARILPLATEMGDWGVRVEGYTAPGNQSSQADWQIVTPGYFEAMGLRLREGRFLDVRDDLTGPLSLVVNRRFVDLYLEHRAPIGARVQIGGNGNQPQYQIVGVVDDVHHNTLTSEVKAQFYATVAQFARSPGNTVRSLSLVIRTTGEPNAVIEPVRAVIHALDPRLPISEVRSLDEIVAGSIAAPRFAMQLLAVFGVAALLLSAVGLYGVVSHAVALRQQEFGIRAALGAKPGQLLRLSLGAGLRQTALGIGIGVVAAVGMSRLLGSLLQGVTPTDPLTFGSVVGLTALMALGASAVPARRAARAEPGMVLRAD